MPSIRRSTDQDESDWDVIPFPIQSGDSSRETPTTAESETNPFDDDGPQTTDDVLAAFATMSRRINDLARELKCLGYFDDDGDRPRAA
jgi:hypothetical protein